MELGFEPGSRSQSQGPSIWGKVEIPTLASPLGPELQLHLTASDVKSEGQLASDETLTLGATALYAHYGANKHARAQWETPLISPVQETENTL